jgi:transposase
MGRRIIFMIEVKEVLYRWCHGVGKKTLAKSLGIARNTIREIINQAIVSGLTRDSSLEQLDQVVERLQENRNKKKEQPSSIQLKLVAYHQQMKDWLEIPAMTITQMVRLLAEQGTTISETSIRTYVRRNFDQTPRSTIHMITAPGRQAQVDFGYMGLMKEPATGKLRKSYAFIMTLSHSRYRFVRFVFHQNIANWIDCHIRAFTFFHGVPHTILIDNLKDGVIKPDIYDPLLNKAYGELEKHYGFIIDTAKVREAKHKGKVERSVAITRQQLIAGREYESINEANQKAVSWCKDEIAQRITRSTGKTPWDLFIREDQPALKPIPSTAYECSVWQRGIVHRDQHVVFAGSFYSLPYQYVGQILDIRATTKIVQFFLEMKLLKTHVIATNKGQWITDQLDYPEGARIFLEQDEQYCLTKGQEVGNATNEFLTLILTPSSLTRRRKAQAVLRLAEKYGTERLESACRRAIAFGNLEYLSLKNILAKDLDKVPLEATLIPDKTKTEQGAFLRNPKEFVAATEGV